MIPRLTDEQQQVLLSMPFDELQAWHERLSAQIEEKRDRHRQLWQEILAGEAELTRVSMAYQARCYHRDRSREAEPMQTKEAT